MQWFIEGGIEAILHGQMRLSTDDERYRALQIERDRFMQASALLTVINSLTSDVFVGTGAAAQRPLVGVQQNVILGIGDNNPITLTQGRHSVSVNFNRGEVYGYVRSHEGRDPLGVGIRPVNTNPPGRWDGTPNPMWITSSSISVGHILDGPGLKRDHILAMGDHFYLKHQFDMSAFLIEEGLSLMIGLSTLGLADVAATGISVLESLAGLPMARNDARNLQNDFITVRDAAIFGDYQEHFALRGVVITEEGRPPQILSWATANTQESLRALNTVLFNNRNDLGHITYPRSHYAITQGSSLMQFMRNPNDATPRSFTWTQFMQNPDEVFRVYAGLNGLGTSQLYNQAINNWRDRDQRIENPPPPEPPQPYNPHGNTPMPQ